MFELPLNAYLLGENAVRSWPCDLNGEGMLSENRRRGEEEKRRRGEEEKRRLFSGSGCIMSAMRAFN